ncbi:MAG: hypothetical protein KAQ65_05350, partial [Candidatus Thorarchaeota archaeon]|nr:hypothetical protein [Candidatus Thorarchaeota archaeon]
HLTETESGRIMGEEYETAIGLAGSTNMTVEEMASHTGLSIGDLFSFLQRVRWLTYAVMAIADSGKMSTVREHAQRLFDELDKRFNTRGNEE